MDRYSPLLRAAAELQAEEGRRRHGHAVRAAGEAQPVVQHQADDLAEAERHDRQVVAVHSQYGEAEQRAGQRGGQRRQRQHRPEAQTEVVVAQRQAVGADGVEGHVAEVEQAGEADHDVQAEAEQHVDQAEDHHGEQVLAGEEREDHRGHQHQRDDPAQARLVAGLQHADAGVGRLEALQDRHAGFRLQEQAEQEAPRHHRADQPGQAHGLQVEAVAVEDHADDRAEHDQRDQPGEHGIQQDLFHVEAPGRRGLL
ncbi:hypothetical protein D9M68_435390 [compost metagenome]